ncbi:MAG: VOC family protein [Planctomycetota bacterium]
MRAHCAGDRPGGQRRRRWRRKWRWLSRRFGAPVGGEIVSEPEESDWGHRVVVRDPDGHLVELTEARE